MAKSNNAVTTVADNPFVAIENAVKQYDAVAQELMTTRDELNDARALHQEDVERLTKDNERLIYQAELQAQAFAQTDRRLEFYRRKAEALTGKLELLSRAAAATYQEAMQDVYRDSKPLPEEEAAQHEQEQADGAGAADIISRLQTLTTNGQRS